MKIAPLLHHWSPVSLALLFFAALAPAARAETVNAQVTADFNGYLSNAVLSADNNPAQLHGLDTGLVVTSGTKDWLGGTGAPHTYAGTLASGLSPDYAITQSAAIPANVFRVYAPRSAGNAPRQTYRNFIAPMTGAIWGSFLLQQSKTESEDYSGTDVFQTTGLTFNAVTINPDDTSTANRRRIYAIGPDLVLGGTSATGADAVTVPGVFTAGQTALVLFRHDTATKRTDLWVDPASLPADPALLLSGTGAAYSGTLDLLGTGTLATIGLGGNYYVDVSAGNARSGDLDALRFDASAHAYYAVAGLPTPPDFPRAPVIADFNDTAVGQLGSSSSTTNDNKGIGFSNAKWDGGSNDTTPAFSSVVATGAEDLVAPAYTRHAIVQSGPPRCVWGNHGTVPGVIRGAWRTLTAPLSGEVWGSFLVQNGKSEHSTGLYFNHATGGSGAPSNRSIAAVGTALVIRNYSNVEVANIPNVFTLGETALVLFRLNTATQQLTVWVNPVLPDNVVALADLTPTCDISTSFTGAGTPVERVGVMITGGQTSLAASAGKLDALYLASGDTGYYAVTGLVAKPHILAQPQSQTLTTGGTATFTVSATSQWPLLYQWTHGGTAIISATTGTLTIPDVQSGDAGAYQVIVSHDDGIGSTTSAVAALTVGTPEPLVINSGPDLSPAGTVGAGMAVSMVISASGNEPLTYQWLKGGTAITSATSATYAIASVTVADAGAYSVVVDDPVNDPLTSGTVTLTVVGPPQILTQPSGTSVIKGSPAAFTVSATCATGPIGYQWFHSGTEILGATGVSYTIQNADTTDAGGYAVKVSNADAPAYYVMSSTATLTVSLVDIVDAPVIADFNDCAVGSLNGASNNGKGVGFSEERWNSGSGVIQVVAEDLTAPASTRYGIVQPTAAPFAPRGLWQNYANGSRQQTRLLASPLSGAVWGSFLVRNLNQNQIAGLTFNVDGTLADGSETSATRWLYAKGTSLVVRSHSGAVVVNEADVFTLGQTALVLFSYDTAAQRLKVWVNPVLTDTAEGMAATSSTFAYDSGGTPLDLFGATGQLSKIGVVFASYTTTVANANRLDSLRLASGADGYYRVTGISIPPVILTQPVTQIKDVGEPATFTVSATGLGALAYQWLHSGTAIPTGTAATLTIPATVREDRGWYEVVVSHAAGAGAAISDPAALIFRDEAVPLAVTSLQLIPSSTVHTGTAVSMIVSATGTEPITYQWLKSGSDITGATSDTYAIDPVAPADSGEYSVRINDLAGVPLVSDTLTLAVLGPPVILTQPVSQTVVGSGSASFSVSATSVSPITYQWSRDGLVIPGAAAATYDLPHVQMNDAGGYSVKVTNADYPDQYFTLSSTATLTVIPTDKVAAPVVADFNDYLVGDLNGTANNGKGIGFGEERWSSGSAAVKVAEGDLAAPASTRYGITQPVDAPFAPRSLWLNYAAGPRQQIRALASPLSGAVWGSFLVKNLNENQFAGLTFNVAGSLGDSSETTAACWLYARGASLVVRASDQSESVVPKVFTLGETALVLFSYDTAAKKLNVWVNPVIAGSAEAFASVAPTFTSGSTPLDLFGSSDRLSTIGVVLKSGVTDAATANRLDSLRLSSGESGYYHVTGLSVPPVIVTQPDAKTVVPRNESATLTVSATGVVPLLYQWTLWDVPIAGATGASLTIPHVQAENQGKYRVIVSNDGGSGSVTSDLAVVLVKEDLITLAITGQPALAEFGGGIVPPYLPDGAPLVLSVEATGTPPLEYQWRKNGVAITSATTSAFSIPVARVADSGDYDVEIVDLARERVTSNPVPLRVQIPPSIITQPQNAVSYVGGPVSFMVEAEGTDITYQWKRNGTDIAGAVSATLSLTNLTAADDGAAYTVVVANGVGSVESAPATLTLEGATKPDLAGSVSSAADATVANGTQAGANLDGTGLAVSAFGATDGARKSYLSFDLPLAVESVDATDASLALTLGGDPFVNGGTGATHPRNPVRLRLHGVINNADTWAENTVTWDTAPVRANSATAPGAGTVPLAEVTVDVATRLAGDTVTFGDPRIAQFLNWAAGRRGDLYGNGTASDTDHKVTFVITSIDEGTDFAGVRFADKEAGPASAPALAFDTTGTASAAPAALENERYTVTLAADLGIDVTDKTTGATAHFAASFEVLYNTADPSLSYATTGVAPEITLPTWKTDMPELATAPGDRAHDYGAARGTRVPLLPAHAVISDGQITWRFAPSDAAIAGFRAALELPTGAAAPRLRWTLAPGSERYYAVSFTGLPEVPNEEIDAFYMPGVWDGRRFPAKQYVIDEIRATTPAVLRKIIDQTVVAGAAVDPFEIPVRVSNKANTLFGLYTTDLTATQNLPAIAAPLYGGLGSRTDGTLSFSVRLVVNGGTLDATIRDVVTGVYGFHDYRQNLAGGSLNTAIDNLVDFLLTEDVDPVDGVAKGYSYWRPNEKANEYVNDNPDTVRFQSAATALGLAMVRDDVVYYEKRALPSIEYFVSRPKDSMVFTGTGVGEPLGGPLSSYYATDYFTLAALTGGRTSAYATLADQAWMTATASDSTIGGKTLLGTIDAGATLTREQVLGDVAHGGGWSFKLWHSLIAGYKATGKAEYLDDAKILAAAYIKYRYTEGPASDFVDVANSFWNQIGGRWESLLEMSELTGDVTYAEHAAKAMDEFIRHIQFAPALNDLTVDGLSTATPAIKSSLVSEVGLAAEASASSVSHRGIFMSAYAAPSLMRVAGLTTDSFYAAVGRSGIIGRWLNYPGYTIRDHYYADLLRADYPLRWYSEYLNTAHMNHPAMLAPIAIDFLMADAEYKSLGAVKFPYQFSDSKAYFRGRVFGGAPGQFYGENGVWPWLPRGLVTLSGENAVQLNYVAGHGNGRLYLTFSNQTTTEVTATVTVRADKVQLTPGGRMRVWRDNVQQNYGAFTNGATTVTVSPGGFTAVAIDNATPVLGLQADYQNGHGGALPAESFSQRNDPQIGQVTGVVLSLSPTRQSAYVYASAGTATLQSATLTYSIDGGLEQTLPKNEFPFEFSVPLPAGTQYFTYSVSGTPVGGGSAIGGMTDTLYLTTPPLITRYLHPESQTKTSGEAVLFGVETDDPGNQYTYQWFRNDVPISGATSSSYGFLCTTADDGSEYYVVVTKGLIDVVSDPATLTVSAVPDVVITTDPAGTGGPLPEGTVFTLTVVAQNADSYQWFKDGQVIPGAVSGSLALAGAAYESGDYHVVAYGLVAGVRGSVASAAATVIFTPVPGAPTITAQPQGKAAATGTALALSVAATGATSYQWYHDGAALSGATSSVLNLSGLWTDNGIYHVVISNSAGSTVSRRAVVTILPGSVNIIEQPVGGIIQHGSPFTLSVAVGGEAEFQWRKDGVAIPGATSATLALAGKPSDAGVYDVVITTPVGETISAPATVTVTPDPDSRFAQSSAIAAGASGTLYVADASRHIIQAIAPDKNVTTFVGTLDSPGAVDGVGTAAKFNTPADLVSRSGTLYVADAGNNSIRTVTLSTSMVSTLLSGTVSDTTKRLSNPSAIAVDAAGNVYVADTGNHVIRRVSASGTVTTLAGAQGVSGTADASGTQALFNAPAGIALLEMGSSGTLYIADTGNHTIRAIALDGSAVSTVAGQPAVAGSDDGPGSAALLNAPRGLVLDGPDLYFVDTGNSLVRKLSGGTVTTIAGYPGIDAMPGVPGFKDGSGTNAWFNHPEDIALAPDGTLYVADTGNKAIRAIDTDDNVVTLSVTATTSGSSQPPSDGGGSSGGGGGGALSLWALALLTLSLIWRRCRTR
ncbi:immunoglobulin domain-containing protein [Termitidicoccus mucosus]|uniref:Ig-like domain-containing protein n=1 Tax=Termitidicoccus mucosus TaxID=1184151 RepID=A0A178IK79_9BACT|nr:hypothetical protein AW736_00920 [Opitutaceae bacterium TSB47]